MILYKFILALGLLTATTFAACPITAT
ncbi:unnamed protein product, partial [Rotaria socialis]